MKSKIVWINFTIMSCILATGFLLARTYTRNEGMPSNLSPEIIQSGEQLPVPVKTVEIEKKSEQLINPLQDSYNERLARLNAVRISGSLEELIKEADKIEGEWGQKGGKFYGLLFRKFLAILTSNRFIENNSVLELSQKYAMTALEKADTLDLEAEWHLLMYLRYPIGDKKLDKTGVEQRRERAKLWLHALRRLENEKDKNFDPNALPKLNVELPSGVNGVAGMSPESIKDKKLRAEYERAIAENAEKMEYYNKQYKLRQNEDLITKQAVKYISTVYAQPLADLQELDKLLNDYNISEILKEKIRTQTEFLIESRRKKDIL